MWERINAWMKFCREKNNVLGLRWRPVRSLLNAAAFFGGLFQMSLIFGLVMTIGPWPLNVIDYIVIGIVALSFLLFAVLGALAVLIPIVVSIACLVRHFADPTSEAE